jgi:hypothetical protein
MLWDFVRENWKALAVGVFAAMVFSRFPGSEQYGIVPAVAGVVAFFLARKFLR